MACLISQRRNLRYDDPLLHAKGGQLDSLGGGPTAQLTVYAMKSGSENIRMYLVPHLLGANRFYSRQSHTSLGIAGHQYCGRQKVPLPPPVFLSARF